MTIENDTLMKFKRMNELIINVNNVNNMIGFRIKCYYYIIPHNLSAYILLCLFQFGRHFDSVSLTAMLKQTQILNKQIKIQTNTDNKFLPHRLD